MKTIFLSVYDGDTEKNVLRTGTFAYLKASGHRIVLLIRGADRIEYYKKEFGSDQVVIELLPHATTAAERLWYFIGWNSLPTNAAEIRRHMYLARGWPYSRYLIGRVFGFFGHVRMWREFLRFVYRMIPDNYAGDIFDKHKPDLFFAPGMFSPEDSRLLKNARRRGIKTVATAKSWDVLTTKAFTRVKADKLLVFNEFNRREAIELGDYSAEKVVVTGFPQFDGYAHPETFSTREEFFARVGADPAKRLICIAVPGDWKTPHTKEIMAELDRRIEAGKFPVPLQVLARFHPKYPDAAEGMKLKHFVFNRPGTHLSDKKEFTIDAGVSNSFSWTFTGSDIRHLADTMKYSDIVINTESTLTLDAAANDTPVVLIGYDGTAKLPYWDSVARIYEREHYTHVTDTGSAPLTKSDDELEEAIKTFLTNPEYKRAEREHLKKDMLYKIDGKAAERASGAILEMLS